MLNKVEIPKLQFPLVPELKTVRQKYEHVPQATQSFLNLGFKHSIADKRNQSIVPEKPKQLQLQPTVVNDQWTRLLQPSTKTPTISAKKYSMWDMMTLYDQHYKMAEEKAKI